MRARRIAGISGAVLALGFAAFVAAPELRAQNIQLREVTPRGDLLAGEAAVVDMFDATRDSVVFISTHEAAAALEDGPFGEMPTGAGSGFFWDDQGHIVTNYHVVAASAGFTVFLADGRAFEASVVGADPLHDLAVLKIDIESDVPAPLPLGASGDLRIGQSAYVIGSPFGLDWSLTSGVVSALDRRLPAARGGLIQTDAAINSGNSGGPLLDSAGRLIGVNTAILSPSGVNAGVGFAVPADVVNRVVTEIINTGDFAAPIIGVGIDERINDYLRRDGMRGVAILSIVPNTPAASSGLLPAETNATGDVTVRDVIIAVDGEPIESVSDLLDSVDSRSVGDDVMLLIENDGEEREVSVTLARRP